MYLDNYCQNLIIISQSSFSMKNQLNFFMIIFMNKKRNP